MEPQILRPVPEAARRVTLFLGPYPECEYGSYPKQCGVLWDDNGAWAEDSARLSLNLALPE